MMMEDLDGLTQKRIAVCVSSMVRSVLGLPITTILLDQMQGVLNEIYADVVGKRVFHDDTGRSILGMKISKHSEQDLLLITYVLSADPTDWRVSRDWRVVVDIIKRSKA